MKIVTAIVRTTALERIAKALEKIGVRGLTISEIKGLGEQVRLDKPYTVHDKIEIIVPDERADDVANVILEEGHTGLAGDGLVTVAPLEYVMKTRTKERLK
jgi:nitrogen regulatory protein P-II 1